MEGPDGTPRLMYAIAATLVLLLVVSGVVAYRRDKFRGPCCDRGPTSGPMPRIDRDQVPHADSCGMFGIPPHYDSHAPR